MADGLGALVEGYVQGQQLQAQKAREITERQLQQSKLQLEQQAARDRLAQQSFENNQALQIYALNQQKQKEVERAHGVAEKQKEASLKSLNIWRASKHFIDMMKIDLAKAKTAEQKAQAVARMTTQLVNGGYYNAGDAPKVAQYFRSVAEQGLSLPDEPILTPKGDVFYPGSAVPGDTPTVGSVSSPDAASPSPAGASPDLIKAAASLFTTPPDADLPPTVAPAGITPTPQAAPVPPSPTGLLNGIPNILNSAPSAPAPQTFSQRAAGIANKLEIPPDLLGVTSPKGVATLNNLDASIDQKRQAIKESVGRLSRLPLQKELDKAKIDLLKSATGVDQQKLKKMLQDYEHDKIMNPYSEQDMALRIAKDKLIIQKEKDEAEVLRRAREAGYNKPAQDLRSDQIAFGNIISNLTTRRNDVNEHLAQVLSEMSASAWPKDAQGRPLPGDTSTDEPTDEDDPEVKDWKRSRMVNGRRWLQAKGYYNDLDKIKKQESDFRTEQAKVKSQLEKLGMGIVPTSPSGQPKSIAPAPVESVRPIQHSAPAAAPKPAPKSSKKTTEHTSRSGNKFQFTPK